MSKETSFSNHRHLRFDLKSPPQVTVTSEKTLWKNFCEVVEKTPESTIIHRILKNDSIVERVDLLQGEDGTHANSIEESVDLLISTQFPGTSVIRGPNK